jgi:hypothetical protein
MRTLSHSNRERLIAQLDDCPDEDLFELLNDKTQDELRESFVTETLDPSDHIDAIFGSDKDRAAIKVRWTNFLGHRCLRENYSDQLEERIIADNSVEAA